MVALRLLAPAGVLVLLGSCASPSYDVASWQAREARPRAATARGGLAEELRSVARLRDGGRLAEARDLALALVAEQPQDARTLVAASRAEADDVLLQPADAKEARALAALSALDYAERAVAAGATDPATRAQLAWALGTTTHLRPMGERAAHAVRTKEVAEEVLAKAPREARACATLALLHLRLQTLPWIAKLMASGLPESSLDDAERYARRAVDAVPDLEYRIILANVLVARDAKDAAVAVLDEALAGRDRFPRDAVSRPAARALRASLAD